MQGLSFARQSIYRKPVDNIFTRMRPTPNSYPHIGHAWVAWRNFQAAQATGGTFTLIFDDLTYNAQLLDLDSRSIDSMRLAWIEQLTWLFKQAPDRVATSSDFRGQHYEACKRLGIKIPKQYDTLRFTGDPVHEATVNSNPLVIAVTHPSLVVARVVDDSLLGVTGFIRGKDLLPELQIYDYFANCLGVRSCRQLYIPTVTREAYKPGNKESKSNGACSLFDLRDAGYTQDDIIDTLEECNRRSMKAGLEQIVIPAGVLETDTVSVLQSKVAEDLYNTSLFNVKGLPHEADVKAAVKLRKGKE